MLCLVMHVAFANVLHNKKCVGQKVVSAVMRLMWIVLDGARSLMSLSSFVRSADR